MGLYSIHSFHGISMSLLECTLPLFPLGVVLFPNAVLPLRIFEERYKLMIQRCLKGDSKFGVVLIKSGAEIGDPAEPHAIGTVAHIAQASPLENGEMLLAVTGTQRFLIKRVTQRLPYLESQVELLSEETEISLSNQEMQHVRDAVSDYERLLAGLSGGWIRQADMPQDPVALSYFVPGLLDLHALAKQHLLEEPSPSRRLATELQLLRQASVVTRRKVERRLGKSSFGRN